MRGLVWFLVPFALILLALAGCAQTVAFTVTDTQQAQAISQASPATAPDAQCWAHYTAIAQAIQGPPGSPPPKLGLFGLVALKRALQATAGSPECAAITNQLLIELMKVEGPGGLAIGTLIGF